MSVFYLNRFSSLLYHVTQTQLADYKSYFPVFSAKLLAQALIQPPPPVGSKSVRPELLTSFPFSIRLIKYCHDLLALSLLKLLTASQAYLYPLCVECLWIRYLSRLIYNVYRNMGCTVESDTEWRNSKLVGLRCKVLKGFWREQDNIFGRDFSSYIRWLWILGDHLAHREAIYQNGNFKKLDVLFTNF